MIGRIVSLFVCALCIAAVNSGCQKPGEQQASQDANSSSSSSPSPAESARSAVRHVLEPKPLVVPADTVITAVLDQTLSSKGSAAGDKFSATVQSPVEVEGKVAIPKGARVQGVVKDAKSAGRFKGGASLDLQLTSVTVGEKEYEIQTSSATMSSKGKGKRTATMVGGGAAGGVAIGAIAGGGKGAAIGALIGAAAGTGGAGLTGNRDITLSAETPLDFKLTQSVSIRGK